MSKSESYASVWDAIADTPEQAENLRARAELMQKIAARLEQHGWTQGEAARRCGVTQPRSMICRAAGSRASRSTRWSTSRQRWISACVSISKLFEAGSLLEADGSPGKWRHPSPARCVRDPARMQSMAKTLTADDILPFSRVVDASAYVCCG